MRRGEAMWSDWRREDVEWESRIIKWSSIKAKENGISSNELRGTVGQDKGQTLEWLNRCTIFIVNQQCLPMPWQED